MILTRTLRRFEESFLAVPALFVVGALALSAVALALGESAYDAPGASVLFRGGTSTGRVILSSIAASAVTLTALVFSITMLVLQMASTQYSPRVLRTFLRDRNSQITLGVFAGTFTYAMAVLRTLSGDTETSPGLATSIAVLLVLIDVGVFIQYIDHMARKIRVTSIMRSIAEETGEAVEALPDPADEPIADVWPPTGYSVVVPAPHKGILVDLDPDQLVRAAARAGVQAELIVGVGEFVPRGAPLLRVWGERPDQMVLDQHISIEHERSMSRDPAYGIRQLVDIAERALSPSLNDPTTAAQAIDEIHDILRRLAGRPLPSGRFADESGTVRLLVPQWTWQDYLDLAVDELLLYGERTLQVPVRLQRMLLDLRTVADADRWPAIDEKLVIVGKAVDGGGREGLSRP